MKLIEMGGVLLAWYTKGGLNGFIHYLIGVDGWRWYGWSMNFNLSTLIEE